MEHEADWNRPLRIIGRYALYGKLATGGMATVHFGRLLGPVGFSRTVAIKRLHPQFAKDPEFVAMFLDEARLAARVQHPNVVATLDVVARDEELFLVMDYIRGESFSRLLRSVRRKNIQPPEGFVTSIVAGMLHGLHAAHEATDERGQPLHVVHRDVSPQNILVGVDGVPRVLDFGVAKAAARAQVTRDGQMKGKISYMSPEQLSGTGVDRRSDVFAAGVVLWEALTGQRLFVGEDASAILMKILKEPAVPPSRVNPLVRPELDALVLKALEKDANLRYASAREFAIALENNTVTLSPREVGEWVEQIAGDSLAGREKALAEIEAGEGELTTGSSDLDAARGMGKALRSSRWEMNSSDNPSRNLAGDDAATSIYHGSGALQEPPMYGGPEGHSPATVTEPPVADFEGLRSRRPLLWMLVAAAVLLAAGVGAWSGLGAQTKVRAGRSQSQSAALSTGVAPPASAASAPKVVDMASLPKVETPAATDTAASGTSDARSARNAAVRSWKRPSTSPALAASVADKQKSTPCAQPWFVDAEGIRRVKPSCL